MCCGKTLIHILKFCFVILLLASGIALIATGSVVTADENSYIDVTGSKMMQVAIFEICLGIIIVLISLIGCVWAWKENKMFLWAYISLLCMICIMEFSGGIAAFVYRDDVSDQTISHLNKSFNPTDLSSTWKEMQKTLECCGKDGPNDYMPTEAPDSCKSGSEVYQKGCVNATTDALEHDAKVLGGMAFGMGFLQLAGLIVTCADVLLIKCIKCMCPCCCS